MKEMSIGSIGIIDGVKVKCLEGHCSDGCAFYSRYPELCYSKDCHPDDNPESKYKYFKRVE